MKATTINSSALIAVATLFPTAIAQLVGSVDYGSMEPGPISCSFEQVEAAETDAFAPVVQRLSEGRIENSYDECVTNYACNAEDREHINEGWGTSSCDDDSGAAIWLQTWSTDDLCMSRQNIGKMAQAIIDECGSDSEGNIKGYMEVGDQQWVEIGWASSCRQPENPHNHCD